jgi:hypothetical protein
VFGTELEGGTLTSSAAGCCRLLVLRAFGCAWRGVVGSVGVVGTLLGPEGTGRPAQGWALSLQGRSVVVPLVHLWVGRVWRRWVAGFWLYVENCTVDASIF